MGSFSPGTRRDSDGGLDPVGDLDKSLDLVTSRDKCRLVIFLLFACSLVFTLCWIRWKLSLFHCIHLVRLNGDDVAEARKKIGIEGDIERIVGDLC